MASIRRKPGSRYYYACFTGADGLQKQASTKLTSRAAALELALQWEKAYRTDRSEAKAVAQLREIFADIRGEEVAKVTIWQWFTSWLEARRGELAVSSHSRYTTPVEALLSHLGARADLTLDLLTKADLVKFRDARAGTVSARTANGDIKILRIALNAAKTDGHVFANPSAGIAPLKASRRSVRRVFNQKELGQLLAVADQEWEGLILFGLYTCQRLGDLAAITWGNIANNTLTLLRGKTDNAAIVPLHSALIEYLSKRSPHASNEKVFPRLFKKIEPKSGRTSQLSNEFYGLLVKAGLAEKRSKRNTGKGHKGKRTTNGLSYHSLRHTGNTWMKSAGAGEAVVRDIVGHESDDVSLIYTHVDEATKKSYIDRMPVILRAKALQ